MGEPVVFLYSRCLLSKWGFSDGDMPDAVWDALDAASIDVRTVNWHRVLRRLVRERLLPALDQDVTVTDIETIHNPIRAATVDGVDVTGSWYDLEDAVTLTPDHVEVPVPEVLRIALAEAED